MWELKEVVGANFKETSLLAGSLLCGQACSILLIPFLVRYFDPMDIGSNAFFIVVGSLVASMLTLCSESLAYSKTSAVLLFKIIGRNQRKLSFTLIFGFLFFVLSLFLALPFDLRWSLLLFSSSLQALYLNYYILNNKIGNVRKMALMTLVSSLSGSFFPIALMFLATDFFSISQHLDNALVLYGCYLAGLIIAVGVNLPVLTRLLKIKFKKNKITSSNFYFFFQSSLLDFHSSILAVAMVFSFGEAKYGMYTLALRILNAPIVLAGGSISQLYIRKLKIENPQKLFSGYVKILIGCSMLSYLGIIFIFELGGQYIPMRWASVSNIVLILSVGYAVRFVSVSLSSTPIVFSALRESFFLSLVGAAFPILLVISFGHSNLSFECVLYGFTAFYICYFFYCIGWYRTLCHKTVFR